MSTLVDLYWPAFALGMIAGAAILTIIFRKRLRGMKRLRLLASSLVAISFCAALWVGPLGAGERFAGRVERLAHATLVYYEMPNIDARLERSPLTRNLLLAGEADEFQTSELARLLSQLPGIHRAEWSTSAALPLWAEAILAAIAGFLSGAGLAYLFELHRRYNAQWNW